MASLRAPLSLLCVCLSLFMRFIKRAAVERRGGGGGLGKYYNFPFSHAAAACCLHHNGGKKEKWKERKGLLLSDDSSNGYWLFSMAERAVLSPSRLRLRFAAVRNGLPTAVHNRCDETCRIFPLLRTPSWHRPAPSNRRTHKRERESLFSCQRHNSFPAYSHTTLARLVRAAVKMGNRENGHK